MKTFITLLVLLVASCAMAAPKTSEGAADFPPGAFTDGGGYRLSDFKGKVLVLFFYEQDCPSCRGSIPKRNELVAQYRDKPVKFIAIAAGDTLQKAKQYQNETKLAMPTFADNLSLMESAYGMKISLRNIYQMRAITPEGKVSFLGLHGEGLGEVADQAKWKYKDGGYHAKLNPAIEMLEWNQYEVGMRTLAPLRKSSTKDVAASAEKLYGVIKTEAEAWKAEADAAIESDPARALELNTRIAACFKDEPMGKESAEAARKLAASKGVKDEMSARTQFAALQKGIIAAKPTQKAEVAEFAQSIAKKYPETPTGKRAAELAVLLAK